MPLLNKEEATLMGTECPECGCIASLFQYLDGSEEMECPICGYYKVKYGDSGESKEKKGFGAVHIEWSNKPQTTILFDKYPSEEDFKAYIEMFNDPFVISEKSYFYFKKDNKIDVIKGYYPQSFNDYLEEQFDQMKYYSSFNDKKVILSGNFEDF